MRSLYFSFLLFLFLPPIHALAQPLVVTDATGATVTLAKPAKRVVCLFEPILDEIYMLGAKDLIYGVPILIMSDPEYFKYYSLMDARIKNKTMHAPGNDVAPNVESIVHLKPDLVILPEAQNSIAQKMRALHIPVYLCSSQEYADIIKELRDVSKLIGKSERAETLIQVADRELQSMKAGLGGQSQRKKSVYFSWAYGKIFSTIGKKGMMNTCLQLANVRNVCTPNIYRVDITPETLIRWNPDVIIIWNDSASRFYDRPEFKSITAIKNRAIYNLLPMFFFNPHNLKALCTALKIYNAAYGKDNEGDVRKIIKALYGPSLYNAFSPLL